MPSSPFSIVLFDLDGTLVDSAPMIVRGVQETFEAAGLDVPNARTVLDYMGIPIETYFPEIAHGKFEEAGGPALFASYRARIKDALQNGGLDAFEGVADMLAALKAAGIRTGIATSKATQPAILSCEKAGIAGYIDVYAGSDLVRAHKPAPDTAFKCLELLGNAPSGGHVCVVGDATGDIAMGKGAGAATCAVTWWAHGNARLEGEGPTHIADDVATLAAYLLHGHAC